MFRISFWGRKRGYYRKGQESFWFDKIMHFFGGFLVAMFGFGFTRYFPLVIAFIFLVSVFWEIAEYFYGIYKLKKFGTNENMIGMRDTIEDLIFDLAGASVWLIIFFQIIL